MSWQNLTQEQLEALPTHRLLEVYKRCRSAVYNSNTCMCWGHCTCTETPVEAMRKSIKAILDGRGHVETTEVKVTPKTRNPFSQRRFRKNLARGYASPLYNPKPAEPRTGTITDLESCVGRQVFKTSKKPFKSKLVYNTVSGVTMNPHTKRKAFTFEEDGSVVDAHICSLRK